MKVVEVRRRATVFHLDRSDRQDGKRMNEGILFTLAGLGMSFAGFSGLAVTLTTRRAGQRWTPVELRMLGLLIGDSFVVLFLALLPVPMALGTWSPEVIWGFCSALLGSWFILGDLLALRGELRDRKEPASIPNPVTTPARYMIYAVALVMGVVLWLSAWNVVFDRGQALFVLGLMTLLAFAAVEFLFFVLLLLQQRDVD